MNRSPITKIRTAFTALLIVLSMASAFPAAAADFTPGCTAGVGDTAALVAAIITANSNGQADTINLTPGCVYLLTSPLPAIEGDDGNGVHVLTITSDGTAVIDGANSVRPFIINSDAQLTLDSLTVQHGFTPFSGGAAHNSGLLTIINSTFSDNSADSGGAIESSNALIIRGSTFSNNASSGSSSSVGGAIRFTSGTADIVNSTLSGNSSQGNGAAIESANSTLTIINSTVSGNISSSGQGGGLALFQTTLNMYNSILADNTGTNCANLGSAVFNIRYSIDEGDDCGVSNIFGVNGNLTGDPALGALTGSPAYHPILPTSIAYHAGNNALVPGGIDTDQAGNDRIRIGRVDMGSFEAGCITYPYTVPASNISLLAASIQCADAAPGAETINLTNSTYLMDGTPLTVTGDITMNGNGATINGNTHRVFVISKSASVTLDDLTLTTGGAPAENGGLIDNAGSLMLTRSTVTNSQARLGGAIFNRLNAVLILNRSTIRNSQASVSGGGIYNDGTLTLTNSTVSGNSANFFGGIVNQGSIIVNNSTVSGNGNGGVYSGSGAMTINNSIIANNTTADCQGSGTISFSLIEDGSCGITHGINGNLTGDPALGALTGSPAYYPIPLSSIALNAGSNALIPPGTTTDQPGNPRIGLSTVDMGAHEFTCPTFPYTVPASSEANLRLAVFCANALPSDEVINLTPSFYNLTTGELLIADNGSLTINGNGAYITRTVVEQFRLFYVDGGTVSLNNVIVQGGRVDEESGGAIFNTGTLNLTDSAIFNNNSGVDGGAIFNTGTLNTVNVTFAFNTGQHGGAIYNDGGTVVLANTTIAFNLSGAFGGAVDNNAGSFTANNSVIAKNTDATDRLDCVGVISANYSLIGDGSCGVVAGVSGNLTGDPHLGISSASFYVYPPGVGSPLIDAGNDALIPAGITTDQLGNPRIQGASVDIGASETTPASLDITLTLQSRPAAPHPSYVINVTVEFRQFSGPPYAPQSSQSLNLVSDTSGVVTIPNLPAENYIIRVKGSNTLAVLHTVTITAGGNSFATDLLRGGDASGDNTVALADFSLLASSFGTSTGTPGFEPRADFNNDGVINLVDFSLLASIYGLSGMP